ncbi:MAG: hypothetical protein PHY76_03050 [Patescibacteria group bacterium]|nr:hypothetical protein [Patescibacteria group bacterium]
MKKSTCLIAILVIFVACTNGSQKNGNTKQQTDYTSTTNVYMQAPLAYLIDGELYFHNFEENTKTKFAEESEPILNFTFDEEGKVFYYSVERNNTLWLKSANIGKPEIKSEWVINWQLSNDEAFSNKALSPLYYNEGKVIIQHGFHSPSQHYDKMSVYSISDNNINHTELDYKLIASSFGAFTTEQNEEYFETIDEDAYYIYDNAEVCLTDKMDFYTEDEKNEGDSYASEDNYYYGFRFSPDSTKVLFVAQILEQKWRYGPYCIANIDGSNQMVLEQSDSFIEALPVWLKNNSVIFMDQESNIYVANNDENIIEKIAENAFDFKSKK